MIYDVWTYQVRQPVRTFGLEARCHFGFLGRITSFFWSTAFILNCNKSIQLRRREAVEMDGFKESYSVWTKANTKSKIP